MTLKFLKIFSFVIIGKYLYLWNGLLISLVDANNY